MGKLMSLSQAEEWLPAFPFATATLIFQPRLQKNNTLKIKVQNRTCNWIFNHLNQFLKTSLSSFEALYYLVIIAMDTLLKLPQYIWP